jgi:hypothetical protein
MAYQARAVSGSLLLRCSEPLPPRPRLAQSSPDSLGEAEFLLLGRVLGELFAFAGLIPLFDLLSGYRRRLGSRARIYKATDRIPV